MNSLVRMFETVPVVVTARICRNRRHRMSVRQITQQSHTRVT